MKLKIGVFFDGTGNNAYNSLNPLSNSSKQRNTTLDKQISLSKDDGVKSKLFSEQVAKHVSVPENYLFTPLTSSVSPTTNIWQLSKAYKRGKTTDGYQIAIYVNGTGTEDGQKDDVFTMSTGWSLFGTQNHSGVIDKTDKAIELISHELASLKEIDNEVFEGIEFELFGFSRGATAARHFANRIIDKDHAISTVISKRFTKKTFPEIAKKPTGKIAFIGLYDSVAAILALSEGDLDMNDSKTGSVNIKTTSKMADSIFHITAAHELRYNFSLNRTLPDNIAELEMPGSHSDTGGGYLPSSDESIFISKAFYSEESEDLKRTETASYKQAQKEMERLLSHNLWGGIFKLCDIEIIGWDNEASGPFKNFGHAVMMKRKKVKNGLEKVGLHAMHDYASKKGCQFNAISDKDLAIPADLAELSKLMNQALNRLLEGQPFQSLAKSITDKTARDYIHCSAFWSTLDNDLDISNITDKSAPDDILYKVLLTNRPTDSLIRTEFDSNGNTLKK